MYPQENNFLGEDLTLPKDGVIQLPTEFPEEPK